MRRTEQVGMDNVVGLGYIENICYSPMLESTDMVEGVVAHLMTFGNDLIVEVVVSQHIFANHKEGSLDIMFAKSFQYEGVDSGIGPSSNVM